MSFLMRWYNNLHIISFTRICMPFSNFSRDKDNLAKKTLIFAEFCLQKVLYHKVPHSWAECQMVGSFLLKLFGQPKSAIKAASHCCPAPTAHRLTLCLGHPSTIFFNTLRSSNWSELTAGNS